MGDALLIQRIAKGQGGRYRRLCWAAALLLLF